MPMIYYYSTPAILADPGWTEDLGVTRVRLGEMSGLMTRAEMGSPGQCTITFDDPTGDMGHDGDDIAGLKYFHVVETDCPSGDQYLGVWFTGSRTYRRAKSLVTGLEREIECELADSNFVLTWHLIRAGDADRPAESVADRMAWWLGTTWVSQRIIDAGAIVLPDLGLMDACDYTLQTEFDVVNDMAQYASSNFFLYFSEADGSFALAFGPDIFYSYAGYNLTNDVSLSGVSTTYPFDAQWLMASDIELVRNPDRVHTAVAVVYANGVEYVEDLGTQFIRIDATATVSNVKTSAGAIGRGTAYLAQSETETDRISCKVQVPSSGVTLIKAGMTLFVDFTHLPVFISPHPFDPGQGWCTVVSCAAAQDEATKAFYTLTLELVPYDSGEVGAPH